MDAESPLKGTPIAWPNQPTTWILDDNNKSGRKFDRPGDGQEHAGEASANVQGVPTTTSVQKWVFFIIPIIFFFSRKSSSSRAPYFGKCEKNDLIEGDQAWEIIDTFIAGEIDRDQSIKEEHQTLMSNVKFYRLGCQSNIYELIWWSKTVLHIQDWTGQAPLEESGRIRLLNIFVSCSQGNLWHDLLPKGRPDWNFLWSGEEKLTITQHMELAGGWTEDLCRPWPKRWAGIVDFYASEKKEQDDSCSSQRDLHDV